MLWDINETNRIYVCGRIETGPVFSHRVYGEGFYSFMISVPRLSESEDVLPVTISDRLMENEKMETGASVGIRGQLRSYNTYENNRNHLILSIFVKEIYFIEEGEQPRENPNHLSLNGFICKPTIYRTTPKGRKIADILLAVNRAYGKSDYIPLIAWERNAIFSRSLTVGDNIRLEGRMQSRIYKKKLDDGEIAEKTAYEVSVSKMERVEA